LSRPYNQDFRSAILNAFDRKPIASIKNVVSIITETYAESDDDLDEDIKPDVKPNLFNSTITEVKPFVPSYQSTRTMMQKMVKEGLLIELPKKGEKNTLYYTKSMFKNVVRFTTLDGNNVSLREFIHTLVDSSKDPMLIDPIALNTIKAWMLGSLGSTIPDAYTSKNKSVPPVDEYRRKLEIVLKLTKQFHAFVKQFLDSGAYSPVDREILAREFNSNCVEEHSVIVDGTWNNED
jgi:hypothetical protein